MNIAEHEIGPAEPVFLVAELGVTSGGDVKRACALVDAVAAAGAHAAKFIVTDPEKIMASRDRLFEYATTDYVGVLKGAMTPLYLERTKARPLYDLLAETRFTFDEWVTIRDYCHTRGVIFFATADHLEAVAMLEALQVPAHKLSAWDIAYRPLLHAMRATGKPVLVDVGTATREEVYAAMPEEHHLLFVHSPHPPDWQMSRMRHFFCPEYPVGFASPGRESWCDFVALGGGACLLEKRLTLRRDEPTGHHHAISLEPDEFRDWVKLIRQAEAALREDPFGGSDAAWAERRKYDRNAEGKRP